MKVMVLKRLNDNGPWFKYTSWCYGSESICVWKWEIVIHDRRRK
jgi:hypothetical protein